jgi:hypothetical protein
MDAWSRAIERVRRRPVSRMTDSLPFTDALEHLHPGDPQRRPLLDEALARFPTNRLLVWQFAEMLMRERKFAQAEPILLGLVTGGADEHACADLAYDRRISGEFAFSALATCCCGLGRWAEAAEWYGRAAALQPDSLEYRAKRAVTLRRGGRHRD